MFGKLFALAFQYPEVVFYLSAALGAAVVMALTLGRAIHVGFDQTRSRRE